MSEEAHLCSKGVSDKGRRRGTASLRANRKKRFALHVYVFSYLLLNLKKKNQQFLPYVFCQTFFEKCRWDEQLPHPKGGIEKDVPMTADSNSRARRRRRLGRGIRCWFWSWRQQTRRSHSTRRLMSLDICQQSIAKHLSSTSTMVGSTSSFRR